MPLKRIELTKDDVETALQEYLSKHFPGEEFKKVLIITPWIMGEATWGLENPGVKIQLETEWKVLESGKK